MKRKLHSQRIPASHPKILAETTLGLLSLTVTYRLEWGRENGECGFWISVKTADDAARVRVGDDVTYAVFCYEQIKRGGVTPCTLEEILEELSVPGA